MNPFKLYRRWLRRRVLLGAGERLMLGERYFCVACLSAAPLFSHRYGWNLGSKCWVNVFDGSAGSTVTTYDDSWLTVDEAREAREVRLMMTAMCIALNDAGDLDEFIS